MHILKKNFYVSKAHEEQILPIIMFIYPLLHTKFIIVFQNGGLKKLYSICIMLTVKLY